MQLIGNSYMHTCSDIKKKKKRQEEKEKKRKEQEKKQKMYFLFYSQTIRPAVASHRNLVLIGAVKHHLSAQKQR